MMEYDLAVELEPRHDQDAKCVLAIDESRIASCSRDGTVGIWAAESGSMVRPRRFRRH